MILIFAVPLSLLCLAIAFVCYRAKCKEQALIFSLIGATILGAAALMAIGSQWLLQNL